MLMELRLRDGAFPRELAHGPGFAMLLDLMQAEQGDKPRAISVTSLCLASMAPATTALRHIELLEGSGMIERLPDPHDRRRWHLVLTDDGRAAVLAYLDGLGALTAKVGVA